MAQSPTANAGGSARKNLATMILSRVIVAALLVTGAIPMTSSPVAAQPATKADNAGKESDLTREFEKLNSSGTCKVIRAGIWKPFAESRVAVRLSCGGKKQDRVVGKQHEDAMLSVALAAMSTGKPVLVGPLFGDLESLILVSD